MKLNITIVDDSLPDVLVLEQLAAKAAEALNCELCASRFTDPQSALEAIDPNKAEDRIFFVDVMMPGLYGTELVPLMRENCGDNTPVSYTHLYNAVSADYIDCLRREGLLPVLRARLDYLIDTSAELNGSLDFVYDTGLNKLIGLEKGILPMLAVILLACCPFLKERESGFVNLLRTGKNGRGRIFLTRLAFVLLCAFAVTILFSAAELYALSGDGIFESLKTPAASLEALRKMGTTPIGAYLAGVSAMRLAAALCIALITYALSTRFESPFAVLAPALGWLLVSFALRRLGVSFPPADLSAFVSGHAAFAKAGRAAWLNMLPLIAATVLLVAYSYRRFTRTVK